MGDIYFSKLAKNHMEKWEYMSCFWLVRGYPSYREIIEDPETPERRKMIMEKKLKGIDHAVDVIPGSIQGIVLDHIIHGNPLPARDKMVQECLIRFLEEIRDHVLWCGIPGNPYRPRPYRSRA